MAAHGDARIEALLRAALRERPSDVVDLVRAAREAEPGLVRGREGEIHALLLRGVRTARLHVAGRSERGLGLYTLAPEAAAPAPDLPPLLEAPVDAAASRVALRVAEGVRDPLDRGRIVSEVLAHLSDLRAGPGVTTFGSPRTASHLVRRAAAGRPVVAFPATAGDHARRFAIHEGPWIVGAVAAFFLLRAFVLGVYVIPSSSMEPTLHIGDRVVVFKPGGRRLPERWQIVTFERKGTTYVKRVVGLPGEHVAIVHGEVWIDGRIVSKPPGLREGLRAPYERWDLSGGTAPVGWETRTEDAATVQRFRGHLTAHGGPQLEPPLPGTFELRDGYLDLDGERPAAGRLALELWKAADADGGPPDRWTLSVDSSGVRLRAGGQEVRLGDAPPPGPIHLSLSHVDGLLRAAVGALGREIPQEAPDAPLRFLVRVAGGAHVRTLALDSDLHYSYIHSLAIPDAYGSQDPARYAYEVPEDALFLLGDNTTNSSDSRNAAMGPVRLSELIGPVSVRIWPPARVGGVK